jgi:hypothetical protein
MDFYRLASVKATIFVMDNKPINDIRKFLAPHMDIESVKWVANLAVSTIANHFAPGLDQALTGNDVLDVAVGNTVELGELLTRTMDEVIVDVICRWLDGDPAIEELFEFTEEQARADAAIKEDAEKAAAVIEELTGEIEQKIAEEPSVAEQEINALMSEFEEERKDLENKLDRIADKFFENRPDLDDNTRANAEEQFKEIKDEQVEALEAKQAERLSERMDRQDERRANFEEKQQELEGTRDERS